jgi:transposase
MEKSKTATRYSAEMRSRAVRMVLARGGSRLAMGGSDERERIKVLERENRELRQANEILRKASAYFAVAELDRRSKP